MKTDTYTVEDCGFEFVVFKNGELYEVDFNYLSEAQERADELNGEK